MNEISILMYLLSKKTNPSQIGARKKEILKELNISNKNKSTEFNILITELAKYIEPLGLQIRYNPIDSHWFLTFDSEISEFINSNPFMGRPSLGATLFYIITSCLNNSGFTTVKNIGNLRKKKGILQDLKDLEKQGYIILEKESDEIRLTPLIGYKLDINKLFINLALKLKE